MADNPYINKVVFGDDTLIDLTDATATAADIAQGVTAYGASGALLTGTATGGGGRCAFYGTSSTAAGTAAKVVTCEGFTLTAGNFIAVFFTVGSTAATPTLNVNSTGAVAIRVGGIAPSGTTNVLKWSSGTVLYFVYDGTYFRYLGSMAAGTVEQPDGGGAWYGTSSTAATTAAKTSSITNFRMTKGAFVAIRFSTANTYTSSALTLNVNATGAKTIYKGSSATSSSNTLTWSANTTLCFAYDGNYWRYVCTDASGGGSYTLPTASTSTKGGVKVPDDYTLLVDDEVLKIAFPNYSIGIDSSFYASTYSEVLGVLTAFQVPVIQEWLEVGDPNSPIWVSVTHAVKDVVVDDVGDGLGLITLFFEKYDSTMGVMMTYGATVSEEDDSWDVSHVSHDVAMV